MALPVERAWTTRSYPANRGASQCGVVFFSLSFFGPVGEPVEDFFGATACVGLVPLVGYGVAVLPALLWLGMVCLRLKVRKSGFRALNVGSTAARGRQTEWAFS